MLQKVNRVLLFELDMPGNCDNENLHSCRIRFVDKPYLNKNVPEKAAESNNLRKYYGRVAHFRDFKENLPENFLEFPSINA